MHEIPDAKVLPLGAVVSHKASIINDLSFDTNKAQKGGRNADAGVASVSPSVCAEALPESLTEVSKFECRKPTLRLLVATADVNDT